MRNEGGGKQEEGSAAPLRPFQHVPCWAGKLEVKTAVSERTTRMHILDQVAPGLADHLAPLPLSRRRRIVAKACALVGNSLHDLEPEIEELLATAEAEHALSVTQAEQACTLADVADERYFDLQEQGAAEAEWIEWFFKARLLTALCNGLGEPSWSDTADAIYELSVIVDDPSELIDLVRREISCD